MHTTLWYIGELASLVPMPETSIYEDGDSMLGKNYIRPPWKILSVQAKPVSHPVKKRPHRQFRFSITSPDLGHDPASLLLGDYVHSLILRPRLIHEVMDDFTHLLGQQRGDSIPNL